MAGYPGSYAALCDESDTRGAEARSSRVLDEIQDLLQSLETPARLAEFGVQKAALPALAEEACAIRRLLDNNVRDFGREEVLAVYESAW